MQQLEYLDKRVLMAATAVVDAATHTLKIVGIPGNDVITMTQYSSTKAKVVLNGLSRYFFLNAFQKVDVQLGIGNDIFTMTNDLQKPATIVGSLGNDLLVGGGEKDYISGDQGNDTLDGGNRQDNLFGGPDTDTVDYSKKTVGVVVTLDDNPNDGASEQDNAHSDIENVWGTNKNDLITGSNKSNKIIGNSGNDSIVGLGGNDTIFGNDGKDTLVGNSGNDLIFGGFDDDIIFLSDGVYGNDTALGDAGNDTCYRDKGAVKKDQTSSCEILFG